MSRTTYADGYPAWLDVREEAGMVVLFDEDGEVLRMSDGVARDVGVGALKVAYRIERRARERVTT